MSNWTYLKHALSVACEALEAVRNEAGNELSEHERKGLAHALRLLHAYPEAEADVPYICVTVELVYPKDPEADFAGGRDYVDLSIGEDSLKLGTGEVSYGPFGSDWSSGTTYQHWRDSGEEAHDNEMHPDFDQWLWQWRNLLAGEEGAIRKIGVEYDAE